MADSKDNKKQCSPDCARECCAPADTRSDKEKEADIIHSLYEVNAKVSQATAKEAEDAYQKAGAEDPKDYDLPTAKELAKAQLTFWVDHLRSEDSKRERRLYAELKKNGYARTAFVKGPRAASIRVRLSRKGYNATVIAYNGAHIVAVALPTYTRADVADVEAAAILFP